MKHLAVMLLGLLAFAGSGASQTAWTTPTTAEVDAVYPDIESLYIDLHQNPELAFQEVQTAAKLVARVKRPSLSWAVCSLSYLAGVVMNQKPKPNSCDRDRLANYLQASVVFRFRPGALGFPARGDVSFAALTLASNTW